MIEQSALRRGGLAVVLYGLLAGAAPALAAPASPAPAAAASAKLSAGHQLFDTHCAACHGFRGQGGVGVPLSLPAFINSVDDDYLRKTVRLGRPGRIMPAFPQLNDADLDALVSYIRAWSDKPAPVYPAAPIAGDASRGQVLFGKHCATCHGANGEGGHGTGLTLSRPRDLPILAPALHNTGFLSAATDAMIKNTLMKGRDGTPMRSFLKQGLSERDLNDIVAYVRSLALVPIAVSAQPLEAEAPTITRESPYSIEETVDKIKTAVAAANMRLIRVQTLDEGLVPAGSENHRQVIVYSCDFKFLNEALKVDPRVGLFLPCRITVAEQGGKVRVMAINPKRLSGLFNNAELNDMCEHMYQIYTDMIEEAVL